MFGLILLAGYGMPIVLLGVTAIVGLFSARYFRGHPAPSRKGQTLFPHDRVYAAMWLAVAYPVIAFLALLVPTFQEIQKFYGSLVEFLWLWALSCYAIGFIFGWASCGKDE
jgi:hypothetical protein